MSNKSDSTWLAKWREIKGSVGNNEKKIPYTRIQVPLALILNDLDGKTIEVFRLVKEGISNKTLNLLDKKVCVPV